MVMLGSYADYGEGSEQYAWLRRDLASVDRGRTSWLIAAMHAPWCAVHWLLALLCTLRLPYLYGGLCRETGPCLVARAGAGLSSHSTESVVGPQVS